MKKIALAFIILLLSQVFRVHAQVNQGIQFNQTDNWEKIKKTALENNKYIFVDCYATWCGPCKLMDKEVYPKAEIGKFMNFNFISIKVQIDTSSQDNEYIKKRYDDAHEIATKYKVTKLPTFLFFSPEGKIVHRSTGALRDTDFIKVSLNALHPDKQCYTLFEDYKAGRKKYQTIPYLIECLKSFEDKKEINNIVQDYIKNYLDNQDTNKWMLSKNLNILSSYNSLITSKDKVFNLFYLHGDTVDMILNLKGFSQSVVGNIITKEDINPNLENMGFKTNKEPDWDKMLSTISSKYNAAIGERVILDSKISWYANKEDWHKQVTYYAEKVSNYGLDTAGLGKLYINNFIWNIIFKHIDDPALLLKGSQWMEILINAEPSSPEGYDTYANLLYKMGRRQEAISFEQKALEIEKENANMENRPPEPLYDETLKKMKRGEPTWLENVH
jgi:thioredoxin-related protein